MTLLNKCACKLSRNQTSHYVIHPMKTRRQYCVLFFFIDDFGNWMFNSSNKSHESRFLRVIIFPSSKRCQTYKFGFKQAGYTPSHHDRARVIKRINKIACTRTSINSTDAMMTASIRNRLLINFARLSIILRIVFVTLGSLSLLSRVR